MNTVNEIDINKCTVQEACDYAMQHIVKQGGACLNEDGDCSYGDDDGGHCAVGWLLNHDDDTMMHFRGDIHDLISEFSEDVPELIRENVGTFTILQHIHDLGRETCIEYIKQEIDKYYVELKNVDGIDPSGEHWKQWRAIICKEEEV